MLAPAGAIAGLVLGTWLGMRWRGRNDGGGLARNSLKSFGVVLALCAAAGSTYYWYAASTATPWLNPNAANPILQLEVKIKGQPDRVFPIGLSGKAPHASQLGPWEKHADGSEIRYRALWPGRD